MTTNLTEMQPYRLHDSGELDVFASTKYFSSDSGLVAAHRPVGQPMIISIPRCTKSRSMTLEQLFKDDSRSEQLSSPGAKWASFVNFVFHQIKSKSKSTNIPPIPKTLKTCPLLYPKIIQKKLRSYDSYKSFNAEPLLVHKAETSGKSTTDIDGFLEYTRTEQRYRWVLGRMTEYGLLRR